MAEQSTEEEWLPVGWTVEIRVRRNGKKDRCFADPSKEHKFNSKPEVLRYLKSMESIPESEGKRRSSRNRPSPDLPAVAVRVHVDDSGTNGQNISNPTSEAVEMLKDKRILESCAEMDSSLFGAFATKEGEGLADWINTPSKTRLTTADYPSDWSIKQVKRAIKAANSSNEAKKINKKPPWSFDSIMFV